MKLGNLCKRYVYANICITCQQYAQYVEKVSQWVIHGKSILTYFYLLRLSMINIQGLSIKI